MTLHKKNTVLAGVVFTMSALSTALYAGGFQLYEQDADNLGTYHAGMAAKADTAATEFDNPAGMIRLKHPAISVGGTYIALNTSFKGRMSEYLVDPVWPAEGAGDSNNIVPNVHFVVPFTFENHAGAFGFGVNVPFGLSTNYPTSTLNVSDPSQDNVIGLGGTKTSLTAINIGPSVAFVISPTLSVGAGLDFVHGQADYNGDIDPTLVEPEYYTNHLEGNGWGYNVGALYQPSSVTRLGLTYRSSVSIHATGPSVDYVRKTGAQIASTTADANLSLPGNLTFSAYHDMSSRWSLMGTVMYTQWSIFQGLTINNVSVLPFQTEGVSITENYDYKNSWMSSIGTQYWVTPNNALSLGFGVDQTPTVNDHRDIRLPDGDRWAASAGFKHQFNANSSVSLGYAYIDMGTVDINNTNASTLVHEVGSSSGHANVVGLQLNYQFS
jgi:long-chain fatty acid transport protein